METTEANVTHLYHWVDKYRAEQNICPLQWYTSKQVRARFWYWLQHIEDKKPMVIFYTTPEEMCGNSIDNP
jgi:hypothetical protein